MARRLAWTLGWVVAAWPGAAAAGIDEVAHDIRVDLQTEHATVVVRRTLITDHVEAVEAHLVVPAVEPFVATALRTRGDDGRWYAAQLLDVRAAVDTYWMLTGSRKVVPELERLPERSVVAGARDPALLMWRPGGLDVYAFPLTDATPRSVEYTLQIPYVYENGADVLRIPVGSEAELPPRVRFGRVPARVVATVDGERIVKGSEVALTQPEVLEVRIASQRRPLAVALGSTPAGARHLYRVSIEAAPELGPDPAQTHAVIVLDRSRSLGPESLDAARAAALGYLDRLEAVEGAKAEVIFFDRRVEAQHGAFVAPKAAREALAAASIAQANGSDLRAALALATERLRAAPRGAPRRAIIVTDAALAPSDEVRIGTALRGVGAVVHVVDVLGGDSSWLQDDRAHVWFPAVAATGGTTWKSQLHPDDHAQAAELFAALVRPQRIEALTATIDGVALEGLEEDGTWLERGGGWLAVDVADAAPRRAVVDGWLWGRPVRAVARRDTATDRAWSRVAGGYVFEDLTNDEITDVALRSGAVSPRTALLALEPGARPSEPPAEVAMGEPRLIRGSGCGGGGRGHGFGRYALEFDEPAFVGDAVQEAVIACDAAVPVEVELTTSYAEIVSVDRLDAGTDAELASCVREAVWSIEFPPGRSQIVSHVVSVDP